VTVNSVTEELIEKTAFVREAVEDEVDKTQFD